MAYHQIAYQHFAEDIETLENAGETELAEELESYVCKRRIIPLRFLERLSPWILDPFICVQWIIDPLYRVDIVKELGEDSEEDTVEERQRLSVIDLTPQLNFKPIPNGTFIDLTL